VECDDEHAIKNTEKITGESRINFENFFFIPGNVFCDNGYIITILNNDSKIER
jgi:hypothetical protein